MIKSSQTERKYSYWSYENTNIIIHLKYFAVSDDWLPLFITNWRAYPYLEDASNTPSVR